MVLAEKLNKLGLVLPDVSNPGGNYKSVNIVKGTAYVAIQFPIRNEEYLYQGRLGDDLNTDEGCLAMQLCALNVIAQLEAKVGLNKILSLNHLEAYYQSGDSWDNGPKVVDAASALFLEVLGETGDHSRSILGVHKLPRNFSVGLTVTATLI